MHIVCSLFCKKQNKKLYTTPSLPPLVTLLFTGNLTGKCGFCLDWKGSKTSCLTHLLLKAWTVGVAEEGLFRPLKGLRYWEEHCVPLGNLATGAGDSWGK